MMNESLMSINERYNDILDKIQAIRGSLHIIHGEELATAMTEIEKYENILKQLEDLYPEEVSNHTI